MKVEKFCFLVFSRAAADFEDPKASFVSKRLVTFTFSYEFPLRFINNFFAAILSRVYEMIFSPSRQADKPNVVCLLDYIFHQIEELKLDLCVMLMKWQNLNKIAYWKTRFARSQASQS